MSQLQRRRKFPNITPRERISSSRVFSQKRKHHALLFLTRTKISARDRGQPKTPLSDNSLFSCDRMNSSVGGSSLFCRKWHHRAEHVPLIICAPRVYSEVKLSHRGSEKCSFGSRTEFRSFRSRLKVEEKMPRSFSSRLELDATTQAYT